MTAAKKSPIFFALGHPDDRADGSGVAQPPVKSVEERKDFPET